MSSQLTTQVSRLPYLGGWRLRKGDRLLGNDYIHSEIYAELNGRWVEVARVCLLLAPSDHKKLPSPCEFARWGEREGVYAARRSEEYHDAHLGLALSAYYTHELLKRYTETRSVDDSALHRALGIAEGKIIPLTNRCDYRNPKPPPVAPLLDWVLSRYKDFQGGICYGDIYARVGGEFATVVYVLSCIAHEDYDRLHQIDEKHYREVRQYFENYRVTLFDRILHRKQVDRGDTAWHGLMSKQTVERDTVYEPGKRFIEGHKRLLVSAPYSYTVLRAYADSGRMDERALDNALSIARGDTVPCVDLSEVHGG